MTKGLGVNQRRIIAQMKKGFVIKSVYDYRTQTYESNLESKDGTDIIKKIRISVLQSIIDRNLFNAETHAPSLQIQITTFKLKK